MKLKVQAVGAGVVANGLNADWWGCKSGAIVTMGLLMMFEL